MEAREPELRHCTPDLFRSQGRGVHRERAQRNEPVRPPGYGRREVVIDHPRHVQRVLRPGPVAEHDGDGAEGLDDNVRQAEEKNGNRDEHIRKMEAEVERMKRELENRWDH